jgi:hypothetical protein
MKLGDNPDFRRIAGDRRQGPPQQGRSGQGGGRPQGPDRGGHQDRQTEQALPQQFVFDSFYDSNGKLRQELFFQSPQDLARLLAKQKLPKTNKPLSMGQLRFLYMGMLRFAKPLNEGKLDWPTAREDFGHFYVQRVVYQAKRGFLPQMLVDLIEKHRQLALSNPREMYGLFLYLKHLLCYYQE